MVFAANINLEQLLPTATDFILFLFIYFPSIHTIHSEYQLALVIYLFGITITDYQLFVEFFFNQMILGGGLFSGLML